MAIVPRIPNILLKNGEFRANYLAHAHTGKWSLTYTPSPSGGLFASPAGRLMMRSLNKDAGLDPDAGAVLREPGLKVLHVPDVDYRTTAATFVDALKQIRTWSRSNRRRLPILDRKST